MPEPTIDVPTQEDLLRTAERIATQDDDLIESDIYQYSEDIASALLELREGRELDDEFKAHLEELYGEWEEDEFPVADVDYDAKQEGGPASPENDPDIEPDPEDAPEQ